MEGVAEAREELLPRLQVDGVAPAVGRQEVEGVPHAGLLRHGPVPEHVPQLLLVRVVHRREQHVAEEVQRDDEEGEEEHEDAGVDAEPRQPHVRAVRGREQDPQAGDGRGPALEARPPLLAAGEEHEARPGEEEDAEQQRRQHVDEARDGPDEPACSLAQGLRVDEEDRGPQQAREAQRAREGQALAAVAGGPDAVGHADQDERETHGAPRRQDVAASERELAQEDVEEHVDVQGEGDAVGQRRRGERDPGAPEADRCRVLRVRAQVGVVEAVGGLVEQGEEQQRPLHHQRRGLQVPLQLVPAELLGRRHVDPADAGRLRLLDPDAGEVHGIGLVHEGLALLRVTSILLEAGEQKRHAEGGVVVVAVVAEGEPSGEKRGLGAARGRRDRGAAGPGGFRYGIGRWRGTTTSGASRA
mmetsp:Transcript_90650/g.234042  ORF Transcript_90650/g.234042 Transcript_90650/m.234042 type:complete len:415 (+) Transcript_90650:1353-2597(+)